MKDSDYPKYLKRIHKRHMGDKLNLENPKTLNEKIQWLKCYYHDPLITKCSDKYLVRDYIYEKVGEEYLVPLLGVWNNEEEIDFSSLPDKFVLKVNWGSGQNIVCKDKTSLNIQDTKEKLNHWLQPTSNHYYNFLEWGYKNIEPKIICEKYIEQFSGDLYDYKIFCYNGEPKNLFVAIDRSIHQTKFNYYDLDWNFLPFTQHYPNFHKVISIPKSYSKMLEISRILSKPFPYARVDFYDTDDQLFIGEITFYHFGGVTKFEPKKWDYYFGECLELPQKLL